MLPEKRIYSFPPDTRLVSYLDVVNFSSLHSAEKNYENYDSAVLGSLYNYHTWIVEDLERFLLASGRHKKFYINPSDSMESLAARRSSNPYYIYGPEIGISSLGDGTCFYSTSIEATLYSTASTICRSFMSGIPVRAAIALGGIHHWEPTLKNNRRLSIIYGNGLTQAAKIECKEMKKQNIFDCYVSPEAVEKIKSLDYPFIDLFQKTHCPYNDDYLYSFDWFGYSCRVHNDQEKRRDEIITIGEKYWDKTSEEKPLIEIDEECLQKIIQKIKHHS